MRAVDTIEHQWSLVRFYSSLRGGGWLDRICEIMAGEAAGHEVHPYATAHYHSLKRATTYWVSDEMARVAIAAARSMPNQNTLLSDLPEPHGFMMFESPIPMLDPDGVSPSDIAAASWFVAEDGDGAPMGVAVLLYGSAALNHSLYQHIPAGTTLPDLTLHHLRCTIFNEPLTEAEIDRMVARRIDGHRTSPEAQREWVFYQTRVMLALWTLMGQTLAATTDERPERAIRRRLERDESPFALNPVRVVRLRRPAGEHSEAHGPANYSHRFLVSGHWRNQWLPSRGVHRQQYIAAFVKGPADKPLVVRDTVRALVR